MRPSSPQRWCGLRFCIRCASWCWPLGIAEPQLHGREWRRQIGTWSGRLRSRLFLSLEDRVELRARHLQLVRMLVDPFGQGVVFGWCPTAFEFGAVLAQTVQLEVEGIFEIGELRGDDGLLGEDGGDKDDAVGFGEDEVAGENGGAAD